MANVPEGDTEGNELRNAGEGRGRVKRTETGIPWGIGRRSKFVPTFRGSLGPITAQQEE